MEINHDMEVIVLNPVANPVENQDKGKLGYKITGYGKTRIRQLNIIHGIL